MQYSIECSTVQCQYKCKCVCYYYCTCVQCQHCCTCATRVLLYRISHFAVHSSTLPPEPPDRDTFEFTWPTLESKLSPLVYPFDSIAEGSRSILQYETEHLSKNLLLYRNARSSNWAIRDSPAMEACAHTWGKAENQMWYKESQMGQGVPGFSFQG